MHPARDEAGFGVDADNLKDKLKRQNASISSCRILSEDLTLRVIGRKRAWVLDSLNRHCKRNDQQHAITTALL